MTSAGNGPITFISNAQLTTLTLDFPRRCAKLDSELIAQIGQTQALSWKPAPG
jgi:hypothetical protein